MAKMPSKIETDVVGEMIYDPEFKCYEASIEIVGLEVFADVAIDAETIDQAKRGLQMLAQAINKFESVYEVGVSAASRDYLGLYNENWKGENPALSVEEFCKNLEVNQMWVDKECRYGFSLGTNDMFPGHAIRVSFDPSLEQAETRLW